MEIHVGPTITLEFLLRAFLVSWTTINLLADATKTLSLSSRRNMRNRRPVDSRRSRPRSRPMQPPVKSLMCIISMYSWFAICHIDLHLLSISLTEMLMFCGAEYVEMAQDGPWLKYRFLKGPYFTSRWGCYKPFNNVPINDITRGTVNPNMMDRAAYQLVQSTGWARLI